MHIEKKELPECLKRARPSGWSCDIADGIYLSQLLIELFIINKYRGYVFIVFTNFIER